MKARKQTKQTKQNKTKTGIRPTLLFLQVQEHNTPPLSLVNLPLSLQTALGVFAPVLLLQHHFTDVQSKEARRFLAASNLWTPGPLGPRNRTSAPTTLVSRTSASPSRLRGRADVHPPTGPLPTRAPAPRRRPLTRCRGPGPAPASDCPHPPLSTSRLRGSHLSARSRASPHPAPRSSPRVPPLVPPCTPRTSLHPRVPPCRPGPRSYPRVPPRRPAPRSCPRVPLLVPPCTPHASPSPRTPARLPAYLPSYLPAPRAPPRRPAPCAPRRSASTSPEPSVPWVTRGTCFGWDLRRRGSLRPSLPAKGVPGADVDARPSRPRSEERVPGPPSAFFRVHASYFLVLV